MKTRQGHFIHALIACLLTGVVTGSLVAGRPATVAAAPGEVLILGSTVSGGAGSTLAAKFALAGKTPVVVSDATWAAMTAAEFDAYDALILGDATCIGLGPGAATAAANAAVWSSVVDGNVIIIGTDETYHQFQGGDLLMEKAAAFTVAQAGRTGAYISLSCYYHDVADFTPVPLLSGLGNFTVRGVGCFNDAHIVATHPAMDGLADATLSNWSCSVHEAFDSWPDLEYTVLAIAEGIGGIYDAPDGTNGTPYILARGVEVISDIDLSPDDATNALGTSHTVVATVTTDDPVSGAPVVGTTVTFSVIAGPHVGATGTGVTDAAGMATFAYTGTTMGTDTIEATFVDVLGRTQRSNRVTQTWVAADGPQCAGLAATIFVRDGLIIGGPDDGRPYLGVLRGTPGPDVMVGTPGPDLIKGYRGDDVICGGDDDDIIEGGPGNDTIDGGAGHDLLKGQEGNDLLRGGDGDDTIEGGGGDDVIDGGAHIDILKGQGGTDTCVNGEMRFSCES